MSLRIDGLSKTYPNGVRALDGITLDIGPGMFGLLGPNGAGKSTLMRTIATLQQPDAGSIRLGDLNVLTQPREVRKQLGYLPQDFGLYPKVSAEDLLDHFALLEGYTSSRERRAIVDALLTKTNLQSARGNKLGGFSGGMRQRFGIALALLGDPQLVIVDEPTAGLDPVERVRFLNLLSELGEKSIVILSTHIVDDVSELCSRFAIIDQGRIQLEGEPMTAIAGLAGQVFRKVIDKADLAVHRDTHDLLATRLHAGRVLIKVKAASAPAGFEPVEPDLEDVYFATLGRRAAEEAA